MKTILITGALSGIGKETAELFLKNGWSVAALDLLPAPPVQKENFSYFQCDVSDLNRVKEVAGILKEGGIRLDALFNCAGILRMGTFEAIPIEMQLREVDVNFKGVLNCIHCFKSLLNEGAGIVNMASLSAIYGTPELAVYSATKSAVQSVTESLNIEFGKESIHVSDIIVGYVRTPMILDSENIATSVKKLGVPVSPDRIAAAVYNAVLKRKRVHHYVGIQTKTLVFLARLFPFASKRMTGFLASGD
ncbi:MAG: SDR family NAD(P)-dependent oxidoreductase [Acidobacteria bacterium]|nr:SDR family NAD(P)-dependent oxidoreductase [Acidobacteriota bacterium]